MRITRKEIRGLIMEELHRALSEAAFPEELEGVYGEDPPEDLYDSLIAAVGGDPDQLDYLLNAAYEGMLPEIQFDAGAQEDYEEEVRSSRY